MNDLRKAAEMALKAWDKWKGGPFEFEMEALRQALAQPVDPVNMSQERVDETAKSEQEGIVMNKILKKLGEKAGVCPIKHIGGGEWDSYLPEAEQKFAELIVDECCLKLLNMDEKTKGSHNYYKHAALEIKKHFEITDEAKLKKKNT